MVTFNRFVLMHLTNMVVLKRVLAILLFFLGGLLQSFVFAENNTSKIEVKSAGGKLTQTMMDKNNTIYVFHDNFILIEDIIIPDGCTIEFDGGCIHGVHKIRGRNTKIIAKTNKIFSDSVKIEGVWNVSEVYPEWFGARGDGKYDDAIAINRCLQFGSNSVEKPLRILFTKPKYIVDQIIYFAGKSNICFEGTEKNVIQKCDRSNINMFDGAFCNNITISNLTLDGSLEDWNNIYLDSLNWSKKRFNACIIAASNTSNFILDNCVIQNFNYGVYIGGADERKRKTDGEKHTEHISIINCVFYNNRLSCIDTYNRHGLYINNNFFKDNGNISVHIEPTMYSELSDPFDVSDILMSDYSVDGVNICDNTFLWTETSSAGIKLYKGVYAANITNNHFINASKAILIESTKMFSISNNSIKKGDGIVLYGKIGSGSIYGNILLNVSRGISCYNDSTIMGSVDVHDNIIIYKEGLTTSPDNFRAQNSKFHDNIIKGYFDNDNWKKKGVLDITGASNCEIYNNKLLKFSDTAIPFFIVPITTQDELSYYINKGVRIFGNITEQPLEFEFSTEVSETRPPNPYVGEHYFDLKLNKMLYFLGDKWVDAFGKEVK